MSVLFTTRMLYCPVSYRFSNIKSLVWIEYVITVAKKIDRLIEEIGRARPIIGRRSIIGKEIQNLEGNAQYMYMKTFTTHLSLW